MYNEFYQHKKSDAVKWIAVLIALIVLAVGVVAALIPLYYTQDESKDDVQQQDTPIAMNPVTENGIKLSMSTMSTVSDDKVTATVTATITPDDAVNKEVDWSIAWAGDAELSSEPIENYLRVVPQSDGSLIATIECYKSFRGSTAIVTVTARDGGSSAVVAVVFKGIPDEVVVDTEGLAKIERGIVSCYDLRVGETYMLDISVNNIFNDVGSGYSSFDVKIEGVSSFRVGDLVWRNGYDEQWSNFKEITLDSVKDQFISAQIVGNQLQINALGRYENYFESVDTSGAPYYVYKGAYKDDVVLTGGVYPCYRITVSCIPADIQAQFYVYINATVSNVTVNESVVEF